MNYEKVIEDFNNGTLDKNRVQLVMDNDSGYWHILGVDEEDDAAADKAEEERAQLKEKYGTPGGYRDIVEALAAAGVNVDWC